MAKDSDNDRGTGDSGLPAPSHRAHSLGIAGIVCAIAGLLFLGSIISYLVGPAAIVLGVMARKQGEERFGRWAIYGGVAVVALSAVITILILVGVIPAPEPPPDNTNTETTASALQVLLG